MKAVLDFTDKPNQKAFFFCRARNVGYWGGYGNGKSYAGSSKGLALSEAIPGNVGLVGRKTYPALNSTTRESFLGIVRQRNGGTLEDGPLVASFNKQENLLVLKNGSKIFFRTLDEVEKIRSLNLGWALVDQAEEIDEEIFLELNGRIRLWNPDAVKAFQVKHGKRLSEQLGFVPTPYNQLICVGNPSPKAWVRREFYENEAGDNTVFHASTEENQRYLPTDYVQQLRNRYPKEWVDRFIDGSWDTNLGQIYKAFNFESIHGIPPFDIPAHWRRFIALDHGIVNPTAVVWGALDEEGRVYLYREYYKAGGTIDEHAVAIKEMCKLDGVTPETDEGKVKIYMDYAVRGDYDPNGITIWEHYNRRGIFGLDADKRVLDGIQTVQLLLKPREDQTFPVQHPKSGQTGAPKLFLFEGQTPWTVREFKAYEWETPKEGQNAPERPRKFFDHLMDAVRYLCAAVRESTSDPAKMPKFANETEERQAGFVQFVFAEEGEGGGE